MLIDDHPVVLAGLKSFLKEAHGVEVIATAGNADEAARRAAHLRPDVFLVMLSCGIPNPEEVVRGLKASFPDVAVMVMGLDPGHPSPKSVTAAGANAFLDKSAGRDEVLATLNQLRADEDTGARRVLAPKESVPPPSSNRGSLSRRELQVLTLIAEGYTNKQIADDLGISVRTVETHRERLMRKLSVQGTAALTKAAISLGLVTTKS
ncbi:MAG: response regulator transcription factor [Myxococcales bacterium]|nr:response regulator transcription factor [Myxococcales bacterium]